MIQPQARVRSLAALNFGLAVPTRFRKNSLALVASFWRMRDRSVKSLLPPRAAIWMFCASVASGARGVERGLDFNSLERIRRNSNVVSQAPPPFIMLVVIDAIDGDPALLVGRAPFTLGLRTACRRHPENGAVARLIPPLYGPAGLPKRPLRRRSDECNCARPWAALATLSK